jgi:hypothetical protein
MIIGRTAVVLNKFYFGGTLLSERTLCLPTAVIIASIKTLLLYFVLMKLTRWSLINWQNR